MQASVGIAAAEPVQRLDRRRVFIFPTRHGFMLCLMLLVILLGSINYDNALGYLLTFLLGGLFLVAMLHTYRNLAGLTFAGARGAPVFAGDEARFDLLLENDSSSPRVAVCIAHWPQGMSRLERRRMARLEAGCTLDGPATTRAVVSVMTTRRGWLDLDRVRVKSTFPLGILRSWAYFRSDASCLVYPRPAGRLPLPCESVSSLGAAAATESGNDDFAGLRPYAPGDPTRAIAWKTLAREQELMIKRFYGNASTQSWLSWNAVSGLHGLEPKLSQLTRWVLDAAHAGVSFGLELPDRRIELGQGTAHRDQCLRALALFEHP